MTTVYLALAVVLALALVASLVRWRGRPLRATGPEPPGPVLDTTADDPPDDAAGPGLNDLVLIPFPNDTGQALVVGPEEALAVFDQSGLTARGTRAGFGPVPQLVRNAM